MPNSGVNCVQDKREEKNVYCTRNILEVKLVRREHVFMRNRIVLSIYLCSQRALSLKAAQHLGAVVATCQLWPGEMGSPQRVPGEYPGYLPCLSVTDNDGEGY